MTLALAERVRPAPDATSPAQGQRPSSWRIAIAVSLALHAGVGVLLFLGLVQRGRPAAPQQEAVAIEIMPAPSAPPTPPRETPPGPQRVENRQTHTAPVKSRVKIPPAPTVTDVTPEVAVSPQTRDVPHPPNPRPVAEETTSPSTAPAPPKPVAAAPLQGAPTTAVSKTQQTWEGLVLAQIERRKHYPGEAAREGQQDLVYVDVTIDRRGRVLREVVEKSQRLPLLDNAALDAIRRASPLPPPPDSETGDTITFAVPIEFYLSRDSG